MRTFGQIKSNIEYLLVNSYGKPSFKNTMKVFNENVIKNKNIAEIYHGYDKLSKKSNISKDIVDEYLNEMVISLKETIEKSSEELKEIKMWLNENLSDTSENHYQDIDNIVYKKGIKDIEKVLESKKNIKNILTSSEKLVENVSYSQIPISSMLKIVTNTFNKEYSNISESEKKELKEILSLSRSELKKEIESLKEEVIEKLSTKLNESDDSELKEKIELSIQRINESEVSGISLYKLKNLKSGL
jgi:hypothetical protein